MFQLVLSKIAVTGAGCSTEKHENNKAAVSVAAVGAAALIFTFMR